MYALFLVLNETELLEGILARLVDVGVQGATILDSQGMAGALADSGVAPPFFRSFKARFEHTRPYSKTIFTVLDNEVLLERTVSAVKSVLADAQGPGAGFMFSIPVAGVYQLARE